MSSVQSLGHFEAGKASCHPDSGELFAEATIDKEQLPFFTGTKLSSELRSIRLLSGSIPARVGCYALASEVLQQSSIVAKGFLADCCLKPIGSACSFLFHPQRPRMKSKSSFPLAHAL